MDVGDVQRRVDQTLVHWMFGVFAFLVQVHRLQDTRQREERKSVDRTQKRERKIEEEALWDGSGTNGRTEDTGAKEDSGTLN